MTQEALKQMYQLLLTEPHAPTVCAQLERIAREALAEHAMRETQRLGQEIEQEPPQRTWIGLEGAEFGWFCHTDFLNARKYTKKQRKKICDQLLSEAQSWDGEEYQLMMHDSTKRPFIGLTDEDMCVVSEEESCSFIAGAKWSEKILKGKNA